LHGEEEGLGPEPKGPSNFKRRVPHFVEALSISSFAFRATFPHAEHEWYKLLCNIICSINTFRIKFTN